MSSIIRKMSERVRKTKRRFHGSLLRLKAFGFIKSISHWSDPQDHTQELLRGGVWCDHIHWRVRLTEELWVLTPTGRGGQQHYRRTAVSPFLSAWKLKSIYIFFLLLYLDEDPLEYKKYIYGRGQDRPPLADISSHSAGEAHLFWEFHLIIFNCLTSLWKFF